MGRERADAAQICEPKEMSLMSDYTKRDRRRAEMIEAAESGRLRVDRGWVVPSCGCGADATVAVYTWRLVRFYCGECARTVTI